MPSIRYWWDYFGMTRHTDESLVSARTMIGRYTRALSVTATRLTWPSIGRWTRDLRPDRASVAGTAAAAATAEGRGRGTRAAGAIVLVPLRLFVGIIWLRAAAEKIIDPAWWDGSGVEAFLATQLATGAVAAEWCARLAETVLLPNAQAVAWIVAVLQTVTGLAILLGVATAAFLVVGIAMNVVFVLLGVVNPSAFYIPMQATLLLGGAGSVGGLEWALASCRARTLRRCRMAQLHGARMWWVVAIGLFAVIAALSTFQIDQLQPSQVVNDPFAVLALLSGLSALGVWIHATCQGADDLSAPGPLDDRTATAPIRTADALRPPRRPTTSDDAVVRDRPQRRRRPATRGLRLHLREHHPSRDRRTRQLAPTREAAVRNYMASIRDAGGPCDRHAIADLRAEIDRVDDLDTRTRLRRWLSDLQQRSSAPYEDGFVEHAKAWAGDAGVTGPAFALEGVPPAVLRRAGFRDVGDEARSPADRGATRTRRAPGERARVTADDVRAAIPSGAFTVKWLQQHTGASATTIRRVVHDGVRDGSLRERGVDPGHGGRGRAPITFERR